MLFSLFLIPPPPPSSFEVIARRLTLDGGIEQGRKSSEGVSGKGTLAHRGGGVLANRTPTGRIRYFHFFLNSPLPVLVQLPARGRWSRSFRVGGRAFPWPPPTVLREGRCDQGRSVRLAGKRRCIRLGGERRAVRIAGEVMCPARGREMTLPNCGERRPSSQGRGDVSVLGRDSGRLACWGEVGCPARGGKAMHSFSFEHRSLRLMDVSKTIRPMH